MRHNSQFGSFGKDDDFDEEFQRMFKQSRTFMVIVWSLVILFFVAIIIGAVMGLILLERQL